MSDPVADPAFASESEKTALWCLASDAAVRVTLLKVARRQALGRGSFGVLVRLESSDPKAPPLVAKIALRTTDSINPCEYDVASRLRHRNLMPVYAVTEAPIVGSVEFEDAEAEGGRRLVDLSRSGLVKQIMPLGGPTLQEATAEVDFARASASRVFGWLIDVARALDFLHGRGVAHDDVKPANVLVMPDDERAVLIDYGLSSRGRHAAHYSHTPLYDSQRSDDNDDDDESGDAAARPSPPTAADAWSHALLSIETLGLWCGRPFGFRHLWNMGKPRHHAAARALAGEILMLAQARMATETASGVERDARESMLRRVAASLTVDPFERAASYEPLSDAESAACRPSSASPTAGVSRCARRAALVAELSARLGAADADGVVGEAIVFAYATGVVALYNARIQDAMVSLNGSVDPTGLLDEPLPRA